MQTTASENVDKIHDSYLPANYEADMKLQKVIVLLKAGNGRKSLGCQHQGARNLIPSVLVHGISLTWMNV